MALIQCKQCGHIVSDKAKTCPNCGCPITPIVDNPQNNWQQNYNGQNNWQQQGNNPQNNWQQQQNNPQNGWQQPNNPQGGWQQPNNPQSGWQQQNNPQGGWQQQNNPQNNWQQPNNDVVEPTIYIEKDSGNSRMWIIILIAVAVIAALAVGGFYAFDFLKQRQDKQFDEQNTIIQKQNKEQERRDSLARIENESKARIDSIERAARKRAEEVDRRIREELRNDGIILDDDPYMDENNAPAEDDPRTLYYRDSIHSEY